MKLLKNKEIKLDIAVFCLVGIAASVIAFVWNYMFGMFVVLLCIVFIAIFYVIMQLRYKRMAKLSQNINKVLHGDSSITFDEYSEGELSVLKSELYKMTVCLREQEQNLKNDKVYLADSIADISHQIRTPLTSANLLLSLLSDDGIDEQRRKEIFRELYSLLSRIDWLITVLLKMSKIDAGTVKFNAENVSLDELLNRSVSPLLIPIELKGQELILDANGTFYGDVQWTSEAILNIVKNCMEHTENGGSIKIIARETALYSEIIISDNGCGIEKEDLPHIFERFYKGKNSDEKSFGIGLALARTIISSQNGTVKAENGREKGAVFTMRFYKGTV